MSGAWRELFITWFLRSWFTRVVVACTVILNFASCVMNMIRGDSFWVVNLVIAAVFIAFSAWSYNMEFNEMRLITADRLKAKERRRRIIDIVNAQLSVCADRRNIEACRVRYAALRDLELVDDFAAATFVTKAISDWQVANGPDALITKECADAIVTKSLDVNARNAVCYLEGPSYFVQEKHDGPA